MRTAIIVSMLIVCLLFPASVFAEGDSSVMAPDSPFYFAKRMVESFRLLITFAPENKAVLKSKIATQRLLEAKKMVKKDKARSKELLDEYSQNLDDAGEMIDEAKKRGRDLTNAKKKVSEATSRNTEVLTALLDKVPEQAKKAIAHAIEMSNKGDKKAVKKLMKLKEKSLGFEKDKDKDKNKDKKKANKQKKSKEDKLFDDPDESPEEE